MLFLAGIKRVLGALCVLILAEVQRVIDTLFMFVWQKLKKSGDYFCVLYGRN